MSFLNVSKEVRKTLTAHGRRLATRRARRWAGIAAVAFIAINILLALIYHSRTYPNTTVASQPLGSVAAGKLEKRLRAMPLLPKEVRFYNGKTETKVPFANLNVSADYPATRRQAMEQRSWLPLANLATAHDVKLTLKSDTTALQKVVDDSLPAFKRQPADAKIEARGDKFAIKTDVPGQAINNKETAGRLQNALANGQKQVEVAVTSVKATVSAASLNKQLDELNAQATTAVTLSYADKSKRFGQAEVVGWYVADGPSMTLSDSAINSAVAATGASFGIGVQNQSDAGAAIRSALQDRKQLDYALVARPPAAKTLSYCAALRGVDAGETAPLAAKLKQTFADARGWGLDGLVAYEYDPTGVKCDFTVWLSAAAQMPSFGAICDPEWSCAVSPNVIINYDRWRNASSAWNAQGGSLEDYRAMVINHETGHWFGFGHSYCPAAGQAAPVMQQQSINLQGCVFNPWPTASEKNSLKQMLGI